VTAEIRLGKKERKKKQDKNITSASSMQGGHNKLIFFHEELADPGSRGKTAGGMHEGGR